MKPVISETVSHLVAAGFLAANAFFAQPILADSSRLCAPNEPDNCYLVGNFPPEIAREIGVEDDGSLALRYVDGVWSMAGHIIGTLGTAGWTPVVGDWDGDGYDNIGIYLDGIWILKRTWTFGGLSPDIDSYTYGDDSWSPIVGDWNNNQKDTLGLYKDGTFKVLFNSKELASERVIDFGFVTNYYDTDFGAHPVVGSFDGKSDRVGISMGVVAKYALSNESDTYDFFFEDGPRLIVGYAHRHQGLFPIVFDGHDPMNPNLVDPELLFSKRPQVGDTSLCPPEPGCVWLATNPDRPNDGGRTVIPTPQVF